ncbi:MFS multidrug transporter-like protein [Apiospora saccharicola]|uniref:MFS multidrug transporter-like protein n=1 Tax=Apiospora saccharicola TaxID=335842 RepID=A0ABR1WCP4_9PEZI
MDHRHSAPMTMLPSYQSTRHNTFASPDVVEANGHPHNEPWTNEMREWGRSGPLRQLPSKDDDIWWSTKGHPGSIRRSSGDSMRPIVSKTPDDPNLVTWDGPSDPMNPQSWSLARKYSQSLILGLFLFIGNFSSTMVAPALDLIGQDLGIPAGPERTLILSVSLFAGAVAPMFWAPLIEVYGRIPIMVYPHFLQLIFNTACGFAQTGPQMNVFRFLAAVGSSPPGIIAPGLTADMYPASMGGLGDTMHSMLPFVGTALGPVVGAQIAATGQWRWIFWSTSFLSILAIALGLIVLRETSHTVILGRKAAKLRKETGNPRLHSQYHHPDMSFVALFRKQLVLPFLMLFTHPIVQLPFLYRAYLFGVIALIISTFEQVWEDGYGMDKSTASFNYFALMAGFIIGLQLSHHFIDGTSAYFRKKTGRDHVPEWRIPPSIATAILVPTGLLLYGWTAENRLHWSLPDLAIILLGTGCILGFFSMQPYVTDSCGPEYASSAHSVGQLLKGLFEFSFPLFGPPLYTGLGLGVGNTILALLTLAIGVPIPMVFWFFGETIRGRSRAGFPVWPSTR